MPQQKSALDQDMFDDICLGEVTLASSGWVDGWLGGGVAWGWWGGWGGGGAGVGGAGGVGG